MTLVSPLRIPLRQRTLAFASALPSAPTALSIAVLGCIALQISAIVGHWRSGPTRQPLIASTAPVEPIPARPSKDIDVKTIIASHLFGEFRESASTDSLPATQIPLVLTGTVAQRDPALGLAIIGNTTASTRLIRVGEQIGSAHLHAVYDDRVVLERDGKLETLALPKQWLSGSPHATFASDDGRDDDSKDRMPLGEAVRLRAAFDKKREPIGYRMFPENGSSGIERFLGIGLQPGDLLIAIDGSSVIGPDATESLTKKLASASQANITIMRGGKRLELAIKSP